MAGLQEWELDFANLVPGRTADQARRRWQLMLKELDKVHELEFPARLALLVRLLTVHRRSSCGLGQGLSPCLQWFGTPAATCPFSMQCALSLPSGSPSLKTPSRQIKTLTRGTISIFVL